MKGKGLHMVTFTLLVIGGVNWLLEAFGTGLGHWGLPDTLTMIIYILVGLSAIYEFIIHKKYCRFCNPSGAAM